MQSLNYMMVGAIALALLATRPADAQILDYFTGKKPILKVYNPEQQEDKVEVRKPDSVGTEVLNPLNLLYPRQVVVDYKKETRYQTKWVKVPTTLYRPALDLGAKPGQSVLLKPVETYTWQLRQVPVENYRPVLEASEKNLINRVYVPRLGDILEPIFPRCPEPVDNSPTKDDAYYDNQQVKPADNTLQNIEPADTRPQLDSESLNQPETAEDQPTEVQKVETPSTTEQDESVLKKPIVNPEEPKEGAGQEDAAPSKDPNAPIPDPDAEESKETGDTPKLINPLDKTARTTVPVIGQRYVVPASVMTAPRFLVIDDEGWVPVK
ncbi:MAG: hypothetical protein CMJ76_06010 [Planctomycetaceae bacterium]|nr:hypothetical protein [Planctomycetaceae bacterium]